MALWEHLRKAQDWLNAGGGERVLDALRQLVAAGIVVRPRVEWVEGQQAENPMWFLLDDLMDTWEEERWMQLLFLAGQREDTLIDVLRTVLVEESAASAVRDTIEELETGGSYAIQHVVHGLDHLRRGEYVDAWPPLLVGLEGLIRRHATRVGIIDEHGTVIRSGKRPGIEGIYKELGVPPYYERFLQRRVYAGTGHPFRHGFANDGVEVQMVCAAVAVCGWLEFTGDRRAMDALIAKLDGSPALTSALAATEPHLERYLDDLLRRELDRTDQSTMDFIRPLFDQTAGDIPDPPEAQ